MASHTFTYQTRLTPHPALGEVAQRIGMVERRLYAHLAKGRALDQQTKERMMQAHGLPGRYYNGVTTALQGKIDAVREHRKLQLGELAERLTRIAKATDAFQADIAALTRKLPSLTGKAFARAKTCIAKLARAVHGKKRKAAALEHRRTEYEADLKAPVPPLCFGSRRLFNRQFHLKDNGYRDHAAWLKDWQAARSAQFMVPGSHDEVSGNKTCKATVQPDGSVSLRLVVPPFLKDKYGDHIEFPNLRFGYGHDAVVTAIGDAEVARKEVLAYQAETKRLVEDLKSQGGDAAAEKALRKARNDAAKQARNRHTTALTWRFVHDASGWRVFVTLHRVLKPSIQDFAQGALGLDLNVGFVSVMPVDGHGNPLKALSLDLPYETAALSSDKAKAILGEVVKQIVQMAVAQRRPIVLEKLDFVKKKAALKETVGPNLARRLSSFAYNLFKAMLISRAARFGVRVVEVNPAYTSHMGRAKYATPLGISVHRAAAAMVARRGMGLSEGLFALAELPLGDGFHVAVAPPARMGRTHVWKSWGKHFGRWKAARKALVAAIREGSAGPGLSGRSATTRRSPSPGMSPVGARCGMERSRPPVVTVERSAA